MTNSTFSSNHADGLGGGIYSYLESTLTITNSTFSGNTIGRTGLNTSGGGIASFGTLAVINSTFSANSATNLGGGIYEGPGTVTVTNSTFSGNQTTYLGGGICNNGGTLTVTNSTFFGNVVSSEQFGRGGGIAKTAGALAVTNSTLFRNSAGADGGGISGTANLKSTILADNIISGVGPENCGEAGAIADIGYNISDDDSCGFTQETSANNRDPRLDPAGLKDNGGSTETVALEPNSPAIDAIPLHDCTDQASPPNRISTDQRGALRPDAGEDTCDIGAYEFQGFAGRPNCNGKSVSALAHRGGSWTNALLAALKDYLHGRKAHEQMGVVLAPAIGPVLGYGSLAAAASAYGFPSVKALQSAIQVSCGR